MPLCKNSSGYYTGNEPSPKGLGYCARSEEVGKRRRGNDGDMWIVQQDKNGRLSWKKVGAGAKNPGTPKRNNAKSTPGMPKRDYARSTPGTPSCRRDQIVNPRTNRCVLKKGKIGQELLRGVIRAELVNKGKRIVQKREEDGRLRDEQWRIHGYKKFSFLTRFPRYDGTGRLTKTEIDIAKQYGVTLLGHQIDNDGGVVLDGYGYARNEENFVKWFIKIGATPILDFNEIDEDNNAVDGPRNKGLFSNIGKVQKKKGRVPIGIGELYTELIGTDLDVTKEFLDILRAGPQSFEITNKSGLISNAYVFGAKFPLDTYRYEGDHYNDGGGTGIVRLDGYKYDFDLWDKHWEKLNEMYPWINGDRNVTEKQMTELARSIVSDKVVFIGETKSGDVGANVYTHRDFEGEIDSLIIDSWYFFPEGNH